jgi:hypothetical protein
LVQHAHILGCSALFDRVAVYQQNVKRTQTQPSCSRE